jgi:hypothetical protein
MTPAPHDDVARVDAAVAIIRDAAVTIVSVVGRITRISRDAEIAIGYTTSDSKTERANNQRKR